MSHDVAHTASDFDPRADLEAAVRRYVEAELRLSAGSGRLDEREFYTAVVGVEGLPDGGVMTSESWVGDTPRSQPLAGGGSDRAGNFPGGR